MQVAQYVEQNYIYTSRATEMGRGTKTKKMSDAPEWTPGPGTYDPKTDFQKLEGQKTEIDVDENGEEYQDVVTYVPWNQRGYR